ncbi:MAG: rhomboid family intramembrane serine protease [Gammaproteobacteria bacterium]|jgi:membrane associated rhomboid family serine protease
MDEWSAVFSAAELAHARDVVLVLEARSVPNRLERDGSRWVVCVPGSHFDVAKTEVITWLAENSTRAGGERHLRVLGSGWPGVVAWIATLIIVAVLSTRRYLGFDWYSLGSADAAAIVAGEYWRALTALTLHADTVHLMGNLLFGSFFGYHAGRYLGAGFGWSLILLGGVLGNVINAWVQSPVHRSVGASTAVFAALGLLAAYRWRLGFEPHTSWRVRIAPLYAAIALLAFTGTAGESTDLGAHLFGFSAGLLLGVVATRIAARVSRRAQLVLAGGCLASCVLAWRLALAA